MPVSNYLENKIINLVLKNTAYTPPSTVYVGLFKGTPAANLEAGILTNEVTGGGYTRMAIDFNTATTGNTANSSLITFPTSTASWGIVTYMALIDAASGGNVLFYAPLTITRTINAGASIKILVGGVTASVD